MSPYFAHSANLSGERHDLVKHLLDVAKKARDFAKADRIRAELLEQGIVLEDTKDGIRWKRK